MFSNGLLHIIIFDVYSTEKVYRKTFSKEIGPIHPLVNQGWGDSAFNSFCCEPGSSLTIKGRGQNDGGIIGVTFFDNVLIDGL